MKLFLTISVLLLLNICGYSQVPRYLFLGKSYSKEISLYKAKEYAIKNLIDSSKEAVKFKISPISAANSGELTTLIFECLTQNKIELLLAFYGDYWNEAGVTYTGYAFKSIRKDKAILMLEWLEQIANENKKFFDDELDEANICYKAEGISFVIYGVWGATKIRVFWGGFDSEWDLKSLEKTILKLKSKP